MFLSSPLEPWQRERPVVNTQRGCGHVSAPCLRKRSAPCKASTGCGVTLRARSPHLSAPQEHPRLALQEEDVVGVEGAGQRRHLDGLGGRRVGAAHLEQPDRGLGVGAGGPGGAPLGRRGPNMSRRRGFTAGSVFVRLSVCLTWEPVPLLTLDQSLFIIFMYE